MKLTDRQSASGASLTDLLHVVLTGDTSQNSKGSSYKVEMGKYAPLFPDKYVTGGTYSLGTATFTNNSGDTFSVSGFKTDDIFVSGGTYNPSTGTATFTNNTGGTFSVTGFLMSNLQKTITTSYTLTDADNNYTILIDNGVTLVNITIPTGLMANINVGFIQEGTADVTFITSGTTIRTPLSGAYKIKGQNYNAYLEQVGTSNFYHLLGNIKV